MSAAPWGSRWNGTRSCSPSSPASSPGTAKQPSPPRTRSRGRRCPPRHGPVARAPTVRGPWFRLPAERGRPGAPGAAPQADPLRHEVGDQHGCCSGTRDWQPTGRWSQTGCGRSGGDQGHVLQVGVRSQGMSVSDGQAAAHSGACRSVGLGQNRPGARVESAGSKAGPVDVPTVIPGLPHSAEPQWHIRHGVFSRLLTSLLEGRLPARE